MTATTRAALWLDHPEARIFHVDLEGFDESTLGAAHHHIHRHPKGPTEPHGHPDDEQRFFRDITAALADTAEILLLGPSTAKTQLLHYWQHQAPKVADKVVAIETMDHPTDAQIVAHVRAHFRIPTPRVR